MLMPAFDGDTVIKVAGTLVTAGASLYLSWKGRAKWEPSEIDVPQLPQRIVGLLNALFLGWLLLGSSSTHDLQNHPGIVVKLAGLFVASALLYLFLTATVVYDSYPNNRKVRVIGGFYLTRKARSEIKRIRPALTVGEYLVKKVKSNPDHVWPRPGRGIMKVLFVACYVTLSVAGTTALACMALAFANPKARPVRTESQPGTKGKSSAAPARAPRSGRTGSSTAKPAKPAPAPEPPEPPAQSGLDEASTGLEPTPH